VEDNKYYTPSIEEFHVGFECEVIDFQGVDDNPYYDWEYRIITDTDLSHDTFLEDYDGFYSLKEAIEEDKIRVKYLDKSDIKSLGFELIKEDDGSVLFKKDHTEYGYTDYTFLQYYIKDNGVDIYHSTSQFDYERTNIFNGTIKNKSELKQVFKMIGVK
jgi:hypothetical protein